MHLKTVALALGLGLLALACPPAKPGLGDAGGQSDSGGTSGDGGGNPLDAGNGPDGGNGFDGGTTVDAGNNSTDGGLPNVMIVVDRSGSMVKPVTPSLPGCQTGNGACPVCGYTGCAACNPTTCPTRISELQSGLTAFLADAGAIAHFGLIELPKPNAGQCDPSAIADIIVDIGDGGCASPGDDLAAMQASANVIATQVNGIVPLGGTPTAGTLASLVSYCPLLDSSRADFVLLLTDGEPNCNAVNPNDCSMKACECTFYAGVQPQPGICPGPSCPCGVVGGPFCVTGCIDTTAVVTAVHGLGAANVRVLTVGFGLETLPDSGVGTGYAPAALNAMAMAGGMARACPGGTDAECNVGLPATSTSPDTCDVASHLCGRAYYLTLDAPGLVQVLQQISTRL